MSKPAETIDVWSLEGCLLHLLFSPHGAIEGVMIDVDGVPAQFVFGPHDHRSHQAFDALKPGQIVVVEGTAVQPRGDAPHEVFALEQLVSVDGAALPPAGGPQQVKGRVAHIHYARHGEPNGVLLDSGDFVHTRPGGFTQLQLKAGDEIIATGTARSLQGRGGRVIDAYNVNGQDLAPSAPKG